jgi:signal transduction histidine kinase
MKLISLFIISVVSFQVCLGQTKTEIDSINQIQVQKIDIPVNEMIAILQQNIQNAEAVNYLEGKAKAYLSLSNAYSYEGESQDKSVEAILNAIRIYEKMGNKEEMAKTYGVLGWRLKRRDLYKSIEYMQKGISIAEKNDYNDELKDLYNNYGVLKQWNKEIDSAVYYFKEGLEIKRKQKDEFGIPYSLSNLAGAYLMKENHEKASSLLNESIDLRIKLNDSVGLGENFTQLAEVYYSDQKLNKALDLFQMSSTIARAKEYKALEQFNYEFISRIYQEVNQADSALYYYQKYIAVKDEMFSENKEAKISELTIAYETEKKELALAKSKIEIQKKNIQLYGALVGILLLGLIAYLIINQQRTKNKKLQKEIELKTALAKIETQNKLEEQRLRISRDLHDNIGSQLTFVISSLQYIQYQKEIKLGDIKKRLEQIGSFTQQTIRELRDTIWAMNKEEISFTDLVNRLNDFISQLNIKEDINVHITNKFDKDLDTILFSALNGIHIYRIIQESLNNATKHAEAEEIKVNFEIKPEHLEVYIKDDGKGFSTENTPAGNGMQNIEKRIKGLQAKLNITSKVGLGTTIYFEYPFHKGQDNV